MLSYIDTCSFIYEVYCLSIASKAAIKTWKLFSFPCQSCHLYPIYISLFECLLFCPLLKQPTESLTVCLPVLSQYMGYFSLCSYKNLGIYRAEALRRDYYLSASPQEDFRNGTKGNKKSELHVKWGALRLLREWLEIILYPRWSVPVLRFDSVK